MISVSERAAMELRAILDRAAEADPSAPKAVRVFIRGQCGCGALHYGMALDKPQETDHVVEAHGVSFVVDPESAPILEGIELDYIEEVMRRGFTIHNPNVQGGCTCGGH